MTELPTSADVVVLGGGVVGASVAYHLAAAGVTDVVLVERDKLGCGTTWHSAGNITWKPHDFTGDMVLYAYELLDTLTEETGVETGWRWTGRLFLARSESGLAACSRLAQAGAAKGVDGPLLDPQETAARNPLIDPAVVAGAWYNPKSGRLDPTNYTEALARGAKKRGARIVEGAGAARIDANDGKVTGVVTEMGRVAAGAVVVCAGLWSRDVAAGFGPPLAQGACEHFYVIADPAGGVPADMPSFVCAEDLIYGREEAGRFLVGFFDENAKTLDPGDLPEGFSFGLLNEDWDKITPYYEKAAEIFPALAEAPIHNFVNGPETFTPDGYPLVGPVAGADGLFVASAMNSFGITVAAGAGHVIADMVAGRTARFDAAPLDPGRFGEKAADKAWLTRQIAASPSSGYKAAN